VKSARLASLALIGVLGAPLAASATPPSHAWVPPAEVRVLPPSAPGAPRLPLRGDPAADTWLDPGALLLVPVSPGDPIRVEGHLLDVGYGTGTGDYPDAITWLPAGPPSDVRELVVPTFGTARFALVRVTGQSRTRARVSVAAPLRRPMTWYRADETIDDWLLGVEPAPAWTGELSAMAPAVRLLDALRRALGPAASEPAARAWLGARWLELSYGVRPLDVPFVVPAETVAHGGRLASEQELLARGLDRAFEHRLLRGGERLVLRSERARVLTLLVRPRAVGRSVTRVREGDTLREVLEVKIPRRAEEKARWAAARRIRVPVAPGVTVSVEIDRGEALVSVRGYRQRSGLLAPSELRDRVGLLTRAKASVTPQRSLLTELLADFGLARSTASAARLAELARDPALAPGWRALIWHELATHALETPPAGFEPLRELLRATESLEPEIALPLRRSALEAATARGERLARGSLTLPPPPAGGAVGLREDALVSAAFAEVIAPPPNRGRPRYGAVLDELIQAGVPRDDLRDVAHRVWLEAGLWAWAEPADSANIVTKLRPVYDTLPNETCSVEAPEGLRWTLLDRSSQDLGIAAGSGTHAWIPVRSASDELRPESLLAVDEVRAGVHGGAGLTSVLAVTPGVHRFAVESGSPVLARLPLTDPVPCARLREVERWVYVAKTARFALAAPGTPTAVSVIADRETMGKSGREFLVRLAGEQHSGFIGATATGELELPAPANATELELDVDRPTLLRVRQRLHPPGGGARVVRPSGERPPSFEDALESVRQATRFLRLASDRAGRNHLRLERARALDALGYPRLAALDRVRAGAVPDAVEAAPATKGAEYLELPAASPQVVPLGHLAKIPPLPLPADTTRLVAALAAQARGEPPAVVLAALGHSADRSSGADALLLAVRAEELADLEVAQAAYQRIGEGSSSGEALAQAAALLTDRSVSEQAPELAVRAYALARRAEALGTPAAATLGRLDQALHWQRTAFDTAAGVAWVEHARVSTKERSPSERVKSALLDAPDIVPLFGGPELRIGLERAVGQALEVTSVCHALEGRREDCNYRLVLDGRPATCAPIDGSAAIDGVARPARCRIELPLAAARLVVQTPESGQTTGFVDVKRVLGGEPLPLTIVGRWYEITPERPARLAVLGPTVLRLTLRGHAGSAPPLTATVRSLAQPELSHEVTLGLDATPDPYARQADTKASVTKEASGYVAVPFEGPAELTFVARGRVLANVERAVVTGLPRARNAALAEPAPAGRPTPLAQLTRPRPLLVGKDAPRGPFTLRTYLSSIVADLDRGATGVAGSERDPAASYVELGAGVARELVSDRAWAEAALFVRGRAGPSSFGVAAGFSLAPDDLVPGGFLRARYAVQPGAAGSRSGGVATAGVLSHIDLDPSLYLTPMAAIIVRDAAAADQLEAAADPDVYTRYDLTHPRSFDLALYASQRPSVDFLLRTGALTRFLPTLNGVDKVDLSARGRLLAGRDLAPAFELSTVVSYRPEGPGRQDGFWRLSVEPSILVWRWFGDERVSAHAAVGYTADFPAWAGRGTEVVGLVTLASEFTFGRGLTDLAPVQRPFSERQAEGADVPVRALPATDPSWVSP
jgi:hypothetical protein